MDVEVEKLQPHPKNPTVYGQDEDVSDLVDLIKMSGNKIVERLIVTKDLVIISGHRRWKAAMKLGMQTVPCEFVSYESPEDELLNLFMYNAKREKTNEQRAREGI